MTTPTDNILAIDTSTRHLVLALSYGGDRLVRSDNVVEKSHGIVLLKKIAELCESAQLAPKQLQAVVVSLGPGSFTGLRIGLAATKALAEGFGVPIVGVSLFDLFASRRPCCPEPCFLIVPSRKGEWYLGTLRNGVVPAQTVRVVSDSALLTAVDRAPVYGLGLDPATALPGVALDSRGEFVYDGADLINLGRSRLASGAADDPVTLEPLYLQKAIAETRFEQKHG